MMTYKEYEPGDDVTLMADVSEGWEEQQATVISYDARTETYIVEVQPENDEDDGIREVHKDYVE